MRVETVDEQRTRLAAILAEHNHGDSKHFLNRLEHIEIVPEGADRWFSCDGSDDGHESIRVRMWGVDECESCYGSDEYGHDFCPVSEFCCGC